MVRPSQARWTRARRGGMMVVCEPTRPADWQMSMRGLAFPNEAF